MTAKLKMGATKYIRGENAYLRALRTGRISDIEVGDRLVRQGDAAIAAGRAIAKRLHQPASKLEEDVRQLADFACGLTPLIARGDALYAGMLRVLRSSGIRAPVALRDALAAESVYRRIVDRFRSARPYQTTEVQTILTASVAPSD